MLCSHYLPDKGRTCNNYARHNGLCHAHRGKAPAPLTVVTAPPVPVTAAPDLQYDLLLQDALFANADRLTPNHGNRTTETVHLQGTMASLVTSLAALETIDVPQGFDAIVMVVGRIFVTDDHGLDTTQRLRVMSVIRHNAQQAWALPGTAWTYARILERVAAFAEGHALRPCIYVRLVEEVLEGLELCPTGKLARLVNSLVSFHPGVIVGYTPAEEMQRQLAALAQQDLTAPEKQRLATSVMQSYGLDADAMAPWLDALA